MKELIQQVIVNYGAMFGAVITFVITGFKMISNLKKNCDENNITAIKNDLNATMEESKNVKDTCNQLIAENNELRKQINELLTELTKVRK